MSTLLWWHYALAFFLSGFIAIPIVKIAMAVIKILQPKSETGAFWIFALYDVIVVFLSIWVVFSVAKSFEFLPTFWLLLSVAIPHVLNAIGRSRRDSAIAGVVGAIAAYFLLTPSPSLTPSNGSAISTSTNPVPVRAPRVQQNAQGSIELGQALLHLMPENEKVVSWDFQSESNLIDWKDSSLNTFIAPNGTEITERSGRMRVNVMGIHSTVLKKRQEELLWKINYWSDVQPKFGPKLINISPEGCFGTLFKGCEYDVTPSLSSTGIIWKKVCDHFEPGLHIQGYLLRHPLRAETNLQVTDSGGSGGGSTTLSIQVSKDFESLCKA